MTDFSEEELEMLTSQEREALETPEQEVAKEEGGEVGAAAGDEPPIEERQEASIAAGEESVETAPDNIGKDGEASTPEAAAFPIFDAPQDAQERLGQIDKRLGELGEEFDAGALTNAQYHRQMLELMDERQELREQLFKSSLSQEIAQKTWFDVTVPSFLAAHPEYSENQVLYDSLNVQVQKLQSENPDKAMDASILAQAHERLASVFNLGLRAKKPLETTDAPDKAQLRHDMPPNLGALPASDMTDTADGGLFRQLDQLADDDVEKYEGELARLSDAQLQAYLKYR